MVPKTGGRVNEKVEELEEAEALEGDSGSDPEKQGLMHSVLPHDEDVENGKLLSESYDYNLSSFQPDLLFEQLCNNYRQAKKLFGQTMIRELTGYDQEYIEKNVNIPEFREDLKSRIGNKVDELREKKLIDEEGKVSNEGIKLASIIRYTEELDRLTTKGFGKEQKHEKGIYGERADSKPYKKERFHDINIRSSVKKAIRRGHKQVEKEDLVVNERKERSKITIVYGVDASGSMRGPKLSMAKRAGVALAYQAIQDKNDVGLIIFTSKIENSLEPSREFLSILQALTVVRASLETDISLTIEEANKLLGSKKGAKHLVLLTDALPTVGIARENNITISLIGINLDESGERLAKKMTRIGNGKLYLAKDSDEVDAIILEDYEHIKRYSKF